MEHRAPAVDSSKLFERSNAHRASFLGFFMARVENLETAEDLL
jgi:hypothetical protein